MSLQSQGNPALSVLFVMNEIELFGKLISPYLLKNRPLSSPILSPGRNVDIIIIAGAAAPEMINISNSLA